MEVGARWKRFVLTAGGVGLIPRAPGTAGTGVAAAVDAVLLAGLIVVLARSWLS